ncbi:hypothetical protein EXIGLDRAFT_764482 [Exidia glandulosa HHB12029]|uniref:DUF6533 domain-containing protein n=1 Tax=Exidia glandulosa HHB12029 TaxID=1314781 RepID=A0A165L506_EXIGL|nr:hypothetical protein EXIGLDRAFT_764482 [Exidia glandulosa HHB12029]
MQVVPSEEHLHDAVYAERITGNIMGILHLDIRSTPHGLSRAIAEEKKPQLWDHVLTFGDELELIWKSSWGLGKTMFLLCRYIALLDVVITTCYSTLPASASQSRGPISFAFLSGAVGIAIGEMICIMRTWAIWNRNRAVLIALLSVLFVFFALATYFTTAYVTSKQYVPASSVSSNLNGFSNRIVSHLEVIPWILVVSFDFFIMTLTLVKVYQQYEHGLSKLTTRLYVDGVLYFIYIFSVSLLNILMIAKASPLLATEFLELLRVLHCVFPCRIVLHLRQAAMPIADQDTRPESTVAVFYGAAEQVPERASHLHTQ